jgi:hypothetical protein
MLLFSLATVLTTFGASWGIVRYQVSHNDRSIERLEERVDQQTIALAAFKLEAAQRFITDETMTQLEERIIGAIDRLADRLDRVIECYVPVRKTTV